MDILAELPIIKDAVESYNACETPAAREQVLSFLALHFSHKKINELGFDHVISRRIFHHARSHSKAFGAGRDAFHRDLHILRINATHYEEALETIYNPCNMQEVAFGTKELKFSDGTSLIISAKQRKNLRELIWREHLKLHTDEEGNYIGVSRSEF